jgi:hypothetical protein
MEQRFGHDFAKVRIHADTEAAQHAKMLAARAYTIGDHILFAEGAYSPESTEGRWLIAHELSHVVQQSGERSALDSGPFPARVIAREATAEREIDAPDNGLLFNGRNLVIRRGGEGKFVTPAFSGYSDSSEFDVDKGPIPDGTYTVDPSKKNRPADRGSDVPNMPNPVPSSGWQEVTQVSAQGTWGLWRMAIEPSFVYLKTPEGKIVPRGGFFLHGGAGRATHGCVKVSNPDETFSELRKFGAPVPFVVHKVIKPEPPA